MKIKHLQKIGRIVDFSDDGMTCRVRLLDAYGMPTGKVLTDVKYMSDVSDAKLKAQVRQYAALFPKLSDQELDNAAKQNLCYNTHDHVVIE